jgi:hypothetical protein
MPSAFAISVALRPLPSAPAPGCVDRGRPGLAGIEALSLRLGDVFCLPLAPKVRVELGKDAEHIEKALPVCGPGVSMGCSVAFRMTPRWRNSCDVLKVAQ